MGELDVTVILLADDVADTPIVCKLLSEFMAEAMAEAIVVSVSVD